MLQYLTRTIGRDMADTSWGARIFSYYEAVPYWEIKEERR